VKSSTNGVETAYFATLGRGGLAVALHRVSIGHLLLPRDKMTAEQVSQVLKDARNPLFFAPPNRRVPVGRSPAGGNWNCQRRPVGESEEGGRRKIKKKGRYGKSEQRPRKKSERATLMMFFAPLTSCFFSI
jgi:hypothetical protein